MGATTKRYLFASDFDQTLTFNDSGYVLSELVGIPPAEFERKSKGMAELNLVQQGAELAYLLLHDPEFHSKVRREHLHGSFARNIFRCHIVGSARRRTGRAGADDFD